MQERKGYTFLWGKRLSYIHISFTKQYVKSIHWKDWCWSWNSNTLGSWCEELTLWKDLDAGKDWGQEEKGTTEDEMVGWHHRHNGHGFGWTPGAGDGQGGPVCCGSWGCKESDMSDWLNWTSHVKKIHPTLCYVMLQCLSVDGPTVPIPWLWDWPCDLWCFTSIWEVLTYCVLWIGLFYLDPWREKKIWRYNNRKFSDVIWII